MGLFVFILLFSVLVRFLAFLVLFEVYYRFRDVHLMLIALTVLLMCTPPAFRLWQLLRSPDSIPPPLWMVTSLPIISVLLLISTLLFRRYVPTILETQYQQQRTLKQLRTLYSLSETLAHSKSLEEVYDNAVKSILLALNADRAAVLVRDPDDVVRFKSWYGLSKSYRDAVEGHFPWSFDDVDPQPIFIEDADSDERTSPFRDVLKQEGIRSLGFIPLFYGGQLLGKFMVYWNRPRTFDRDEIRLATTVASHIAAAIVRKQQEEAIVLQAERLNALIQSSGILVAGHSLNEVLGRIISIANQVVKSDYTAIVLINEEGDGFQEALNNMPRLSNMRYERRPDGLSFWIQRHRRLVVVDKVKEDGTICPLPDEDAPTTANDYIREMGIQSFAGIPLIIRDRFIGIMWVHSTEPFTFHGQEEFLRAFGYLVSIAVENASLYASLQQALRAKDEMVQNVSHELRTPLTIIRGYTELLLDPSFWDLPEELQPILSTVDRQARHLHTLVERLLLLQSLDRRQMRWETISLDTWMKEILADWHIRAEKQKIALHLDIESPVPPIHGDSDLLREVIINLLDNAFKFTPSGRNVFVRVYQEGDEVIVSVRDEGEGIPPDKLRTIFQRFYQVEESLHRKHSGMGIGLALCQAIVERHGGRIWAESQGVGHGSTFYVALPVSRPTRDADHE